MYETTSRDQAPRCTLSYLAGGLLAGYALTRGGWRGRASMLVGGVLVALTQGAIFESRRRARLMRAAGDATCNPMPDRPEEDQRFGRKTRDLVDEASWESFPASDAPAYR